MKKIVFFGAALLQFAAFAEAGPTLSKERIVLRTSYGNLVLALYPKEAPETVRQFLRLVRMGVYDGMHFFRVHPGFVAQVSDGGGRETPLTPAQRGVLKKIPAEFSQTRKHEFGVLSMAHEDADPNSGQISFSILLGPAPHLDGKYTIFGEVERGEGVLAEFQRVPRNENHAPAERIRMLGAFVVPNAAAASKWLNEPVVPREVTSLQKPPSVGAVALWALAGIVFVCACAALWGSLSTRSLRALHLANLLIAVFSLLVVLGPQAGQSSVLGLVLCIALLSTFRLLSRFEAT